jgi:acetolactate synthase-1/2/3 large subunit
LIKLSDYVVEFLVDRGVADVFLVSGGGIMHLLDSVGRSRLHYYCNYHEQACAVAAEGYARIRGIGACMATTGPGAVNLLSGILGAWEDSLPVMAIVGQVRRALIADYRQVRQLGPQEGNSIAMAQPVTKYAKVVREPNTIRQELERAWYEANRGRPGPSWLEIPLDVQEGLVDEDSLPGFTPPEPGATEPSSPPLPVLVTQVIRMLQAARRPIFFVGNGIHLAHAENQLIEVIERLHVPTTLAHTAKDVLFEDHPYLQGVMSPTGQRCANFAMQNADLLLSIGSGMNIAKVGFNYAKLAPRAKKIIVDIDEGQVFAQAVKPDLGIVCDAREFLEELLRQLRDEKPAPHPRWLEACREWKLRYPIVLDEYFRDTRHVNSYVFMDALSDALTNDDVIVAGAGLDTVSHYQAFKVKRHQRCMTSGNWGAMGWDLPLSVGACIASGKRRTVCITGDGSLQWNIQELDTIRFHNLPIKVFVFNNGGFGNIRATQSNLFGGRFVGADPSSGVGNPDFGLIAQAYGMGYSVLRTNLDLADGLARAVAGPEPALCEVNIAADQGITPKASAFRRPDGTLESRPLEDMAPFLPRDEIEHNMHMFDDED